MLRWKLRAAAASFLAALIIFQAPTPAFADGVRDRQWFLKDLDIAKAHTLTKGSGVVVAIVDSGVDKHPDLASNLRPGTNFRPGGSSVGQSDEDGHGTAMAGLIVGHGRTASDGVLGLAPEAKALPVKVMGPGDDEPKGDIAKGIEWAADNGAKVINVSLGTGPSVSGKQAIEAAKAKDAVVVAAVGNRPDAIQIGYPASMPDVLAVGATDRSGKHASFSIEGAPVQICAPGADMETTGLNQSYVIGRGTSEASAIVAGAAALVRAKFPELSAPEVVHRLTATATDIGPPGRDKECGFGVLNVVKALTADVPPLAGKPASSSAGASPAADSAPSNNAAPAPGGGTNAVAVVAGVVGGVVVLVGVLVAFLVGRRRKN